MRQKLLLQSMIASVLLCSSLVVSVEADTAMWTQTCGETWEGYAPSIVATLLGEYAVAGTYFQFGSDSDFLLVKIDTFGNVTWRARYGGPENNRLGAFAQTSDGGYAMVGESEGNSIIDAWVVKTDAYGNMEWNQTYAGQGGPTGTGGIKLGYDWLSSLVQTQDGGYVFAGASEAEPDENAISHGYMDAWLIKTDAYGNVEWNKTYGGPYDDVIYSLTATSDGGYAWAGYYTVSNFTGDDPNYWLAEHAWLVKTDAQGNVQWNKTYSGVSFNAMVATLDGGYAIAGSGLFKTDANGNIQWNKTYGTFSSIVATPDSGYALCGSGASIPDNSTDYWLVKTDADGNMQWNKTYAYAANSSDEAASLIAAPDGGYALAGLTHPPNTVTAEIWIVKTNEYGVVPEFPSSLLILIVPLLAATLFIRKNLLKRQRNQLASVR